MTDWDNVLFAKIKFKFYHKDTKCSPETLESIKTVEKNFGNPQFLEVWEKLQEEFKQIK